MPREHWTTVRRTTSPLFTWVSRRVSISYAYTYTHGPRCVEKPLCCFPRFSLDGQWTYRRISFDLIDRRSLLVISSSRSPVKSRSTLSRNWPERSRNVVYLLAYSPCMGSIQFEYEQQSGERKRICIYPARSHLEDLVLDKGRPAPYSKAKSSKVDHLTDRSGSVEFSLPPSLTFSFFLAPVSTSVGSSSWWDYEGERVEREGKELKHYAFTIRFLRYLLYIYLLHGLLRVNV